MLVVDILGLDLDGLALKFTGFSCACYHVYACDKDHRDHMLVLVWGCGVVVVCQVHVMGRLDDEC